MGADTPFRYPVHQVIQQGTSENGFLNSLFFNLKKIQGFLVI